MASRSKKDSKFDESVLNSLYYYHLWKGRMSWIRHVIPVRAADPRTGLYIESYISSPPPIESLDQKVTVTIAYLPIFFMNEIEVPIKNIYPTSRKLTKLVNFKEEEIVQLSDFSPTAISERKISDIFKEFRGLSFTIPEIENLLNRELKSSMKERLIPNGERGCLITGSVQKDYKGIKPILMFTPEIKLNDSKISETLSDLYNEYKNCDKCSLGASRISRGCGEPTFGRLNETLSKDIVNIPSDTIMFIGEAPGVQEEQRKIAFFPDAPAGGVLNKVIAAAGINLDNCYYTNSVLCRPESTSEDSQNGKPQAEHITACNARLKNEIAIIKPKIIVLLGRVAYRAFYGKEPKNVLNSVGWQNDSKTIYFAPHPSFVVRELTYVNPEQKAEVKKKYLQHFLDIKDRMSEK